MKKGFCCEVAPLFEDGACDGTHAVQLHDYNDRGCEEWTTDQDVDYADVRPERGRRRGGSRRRHVNAWHGLLQLSPKPSSLGLEDAMDADTSSVLSDNANASALPTLLEARGGARGIRREVSRAEHFLGEWVSYTDRLSSEIQRVVEARLAKIETGSTKDLVGCFQELARLRTAAHAVHAPAFLDRTADVDEMHELPGISPSDRAKLRNVHDKMTNIWQHVDEQLAKEDKDNASLSARLRGISELLKPVNAHFL